MFESEGVQLREDLVQFVRDDFVGLLFNIYFPDQALLVPIEVAASLLDEEVRGYLQATAQAPSPTPLATATPVPTATPLNTATPVPTATPLIIATLVALPVTAQPGELITVSYFDAPGGPVDWIGMYPIDQANEQYGEWHFISDKNEGSLTFTAPSTLGFYDFRLMLDDGFTDIARSNAIQVVAASASPTPVATPTPPPQLDDHGNTISTATAISTDNVHVAFIESEGDIDYFPFLAQSGASYAIETTLGSLEDTYLYLYAPTGTEIDSNDDRSESDLSSLIEWTAPSSGTYYVAVEAFDASLTGSYGVSVNTVFIPTPVPTGKIAFSSLRDGNWEIYVMDADGSNQVNLTNNPADDFLSSWSPDGNKITFTSTRDGNWEIYVMNADGSGQSRLTFNSTFDVGSAWSPDGSMIAFSSDQHGNPDVYVMRTDGSDQKRTTFAAGAVVAGESWFPIPSWSPDGSIIAYESFQNDNWEIYPTEAGQERRLTFDLGADEYPVWSPDGSKIAFNSDRDGTWEIYVMAPDGSNQISVTRDPANDFYPTWSPDSFFIAFDSDRDGDEEIYVMNADGSNQVNLTNHSASDSWPSWSP